MHSIEMWGQILKVTILRWKERQPEIWESDEELSEFVACMTVRLRIPQSRPSLCQEASRQTPMSPSLHTIITNSFLKLFHWTIQLLLCYTTFHMFSFVHTTLMMLIVRKCCIIEENMTQVRCRFICRFI